MLHIRQLRPREFKKKDPKSHDKKILDLGYNSIHEQTYIHTNTVVSLQNVKEFQEPSSRDGIIGVGEGKIVVTGRGTGRGGWYSWDARY